MKKFAENYNKFLENMGNFKANFGQDECPFICAQL